VTHSEIIFYYVATMTGVDVHCVANIACGTSFQEGQVQLL
jgi:hypothetical protein